jgi:hypothetical protein
MQFGEAARTTSQQAQAPDEKCALLERDDRQDPTADAPDDGPTVSSR